MQKYFTIRFLLFALLLTGCERSEGVAASIAPQKPSKPFPVKRVASRVADRLPHIHLNHDAFDDRIAGNALMLFIDSLDYDRSYFLASDIAEFRLHSTLLDDQIKEGNADFAHKVFNRFKERLDDRTAYVNKLLDEGFDLDIDETYQWKRDKEPWAGTEEAWDELWRKKTKNEVVARVAALETEPEEAEGEEENVVSTNEVETIEILSPTEFVRERHKQYQLSIENNFDDETVLQRYLSAFARSYDPHTDYLSPRGVEDFDIHMSLSLVGIGAMLRSEDGAAKISSLIAGGPAETDGRLKAGDKIIAVAQGDAEPESILHWPLSKAVRLIRGEIGTKVVLTIIPAEDRAGTRVKKIDLIRDEVKLEESAAKGEVHEVEGEQETLRIGQLILPEFYADFNATQNGDDDARRCSMDVRSILKEFATNDIDGVILDLRNDGGGSLTEAIDITGLFIPLGPVVQVRERRGVMVLPDGDPTTLYKGPLIVLVNRLSASASEIVAAALQDYGRAVIVGDHKTHGKGSVQSVFPLSRMTDDLGSIKVTTASFYRIAGGSTQLRGVTPDVILPSLFDSLEVGEEFLDYALPWSQVRNAYFRPWHLSVKSMLPELQTRSKERITTDPSFQTFMAKRERIRVRMETLEVSLKLSDRVEEILAEQEIEDLFDINDDSDFKPDPIDLEFEKTALKDKSTLVLKPETNGLEQAEEIIATAQKKEKADDPILNETLQILADMIELGSTDRLSQK